jgi:hypothetical protein
MISQSAILSSKVDSPAGFFFNGPVFNKVTRGKPFGENSHLALSNPEGTAIGSIIGQIEHGFES